MTRVSRKLLVGVAAALLLPLSTIVLVGATTGVASAAVYSSSPTTCSLGLTINWPAPGLNSPGSVGTSSTSTQTITNETLGNTSNCTGASTPALPPIVTKNTKCTTSTTPACSTKGDYIYDSVSGFATFGTGSGLLKYVKASITSLTAGGNTYTLKASAASAASCSTNPNPGGGTEFGFSASGTVSSSTATGYAKQPWQALICLGGDTGANTTNNFNKDLGAAGVDILTASADATQSYINVDTPWPVPPAKVSNESVTCAKAKITSSTATASSCTWANGSPFAASAAKSWKDFTGATSALAAGGTLTASGGGSFNISAPTLGTGTACPASTKLSSDTTASGTVTSVSGANVPAQVGDTFHAEVCVYSTGTIKQAPGVPLNF